MTDIGIHNNSDAVQKLIDDLKNGDEKCRRYAAEDLGYEKHSEGIPFLVDGLEDPSIAVSEACANALIRMGGQEVAERIATYLASENVRLRNHASEIMNLLGEPAVPVLIKQLQSDNHDVRMFAVDNLVNISSKKSINGLIGVLDDENVNVAAAAAVGIGKVGDESHLPILIKYLEKDVWLKCAVLRGIGYLGYSKAVKVVLPFTKDADIMIKISAIQALTKLADINILPELLNLLKEESLELFGTETLNVIYEIIKSNQETDFSDLFDNELLSTITKLTQLGNIEDKTRAIEILGYSKADSIVEALIKLIIDGDTEIRKSVVKAIVQINPTKLSSLKKFLEDPNSTFEQKCTALECIGKSTSKERQEIIKNFLNSSDDTLPRITLDAIHADYTPVPITEIKDLLGSTITDISVSAASAMGRLKKKEFIDILIKRLKDDDPEIQVAVDDALIQIGEKHEIPFLQPYLDSFSKSERKLAFEYFGTHKPEVLSKKFIDGIQDPSIEIRVISFKVIENLNLANLDLIRQGINDPVDTVQVQAVRTLKSLPENEETLSFIQSVLPDTTSERIKVELIQILAGLENNNVVNSILPLLKDNSSWVQIEAIEALKIVGDKSVIDHLKRMLDTDDIELIEAVENTIEELEQ